MKFLHISDTHYLKDYATNHDGFGPSFTHMTNPLQQLERLLGQVEQDVDFVIHSGDLTHDGGVEDYQALALALNNLLGNVPLLTTVGNHDNVSAYRAVFAPETEALLVQATQFEGLQVVGFDNTQDGNPDGAVSAQVCGRLLELLAQNPETPTLLFTHHHLLSDQFELPSATVDDLFHQVMAQPQVVGLLTGHTHHQYRGHYDGKPYYTADSLSFVVENEDSQLLVYEKACLQLCTFENGQLTCQKVELPVAVEPLGVLQ